MLDPRNQTAQDRAYHAAMAGYFPTSLGDLQAKLHSFTKYVPRQALALMLGKYEIFKRVVGIHGAFIECGVFLGSGLMTWAQLSAIHEPYNHTRRVIGFDTFDGFPDIDVRDSGDNVDFAVPGGLAADSKSDIEECIRLYDLNRPLGHIPRVELVVGDATQTIPRFVRENRHTVVALLYLDFDLYEPTRVALQTFVPRMPRGSVIAFDELFQAQWPGETQAVLDTIGLANLRIERFPSTPQLSYAVL